MAVLAAAPLTGRLAATVAAPRVLPSFVAAPAAARLLATRAKAPLAAEPVEDDLDEDVLGNEPAAVQRRVLRLKELQKDFDGINREFQKELALLQAKYLEKYQPVFDKRRDVVLGKAPVDKYDVEDDGEADKGIQEFWLTAFYNHDKVGAYITERDAEVLKHLVDVSAEVLTGDERGFQLVFHFDDNKYFSNKTLTKRYIVEPEDDIIPKQFIGCEINWKDVALNPTVEQKKKRVKSKEAGKGGKPAFVVETEPVESFFNIFEPPQIPSNPEDLNDDELEALQEELTADFDIGFAIKDQIIPRAVEWFTGELSSFDDYDEEMEGDEYEEDYDEPEPPAPPAGRSSRR